MAEEKKEKTGFFAKLKSGLSKTRNGFVSGMDSIFKGFKSIDEEFYEELEEMLIMGDVGVNTTNVLIEKLKESVKKNHVHEPARCRDLLIESIKEIMAPPEDAYSFTDEKTVIMVVGVNGVGKTTTVGKLARRMKESGKKVLVAAADTFRAAANEQLVKWAERAEVDIVTSKEGRLNSYVAKDIVESWGMKHVPLLGMGKTQNTMEEMKEYADGMSVINPAVMREGLVYRSLDGIESFKNVSRKYLLKHNG